MTTHDVIDLSDEMLAQEIDALFPPPIVAIKPHANDVKRKQREEMKALRGKKEARFLDPAYARQVKAHTGRFHPKGGNDDE